MKRDRFFYQMKNGRFDLLLHTLNKKTKKYWRLFFFSLLLLSGREGHNVIIVIKKIKFNDLEWWTLDVSHLASNILELAKEKKWKLFDLCRRLRHFDSLTVTWHVPKVISNAIGLCNLFSGRQVPLSAVPGDDLNVFPICKKPIKSHIPNF